MVSGLLLRDSAVSVVTGMNRPVVARHSALLQQGLFTGLSERLAGGRQANWRLSARAAVNDVNSARPRRAHDQG